MKIKCLLLCLLCALTVAHAEPADSLREELKIAREAVQPHVVTILAVREQFNASEASLSLGSGSGTVISAAGDIVTNAHVTAFGKRFKVVMNDKREFPAELIGEDPISDLAVLRIKAAPGTRFSYASFADQVALEPGDTVMAMGAPWGLVDSVSAGVVNNANRLLVSVFEDEADYEQALGQDQATARYYAWIQHDAPISPGNSGGPLVDIRGRIVGINTRGMDFGGDLAFSIPAPIAKKVVDALIRDGHVSRADFGFNVRSLRGTPFTEGAVVSSVDRESLAEKAGLRAGDQLLAMDGAAVKLTQPEDVPPFRRALAEREIGSTVRLSVRSGNAPARQVVVASIHDAPAKTDELEVASLGLSVTELTATMARNRFLEAKPGVSVVGVRAGGPAASAQPPIVAGDLIESIEGEPITRATQLVAKAPPVSELNDQLTYVLAISRRGKKLLSVITPAPKRLIPEQPPELTKAWAGWEVQPIPAALATRLKLAASGGFRVTRVYAQSPAAKAGVAVGDLITATNGIAVAPSGLLETVALDQRVRNASLKEPFQVELLRANQTRAVSLMLSEQPIDTERAERTWVNELSMVVRDLTFYDRVDRNLAETQRGILIERIENGGFAGLAHLRSGDLLVRVNDADIASVDDLGAQLRRLQQIDAPKLSFLVLRGADTRLLFVDSPWAGEG